MIRIFKRSDKINSLIGGSLHSFSLGACWCLSGQELSVVGSPWPTRIVEIEGVVEAPPQRPTRLQCHSVSIIALYEAREFYLECWNWFFCSCWFHCKAKSVVFLTSLIKIRSFSLAILHCLLCCNIRSILYLLYRTQAMYCVLKF